MRGITFAAVLAGFILGACSPAVPPPHPAQVQGTAMAAAATMIAMTQAAAPTPTPIAPTLAPSPTPLPSPTLEVLPTLSSDVLPTSSSSDTSANTSGDPCKGPLPPSPSGPLTTFKIVNSTKAPITVTLGLAAKTKFGECGYRSYALGPMDSIWTETAFPQGCYWAFAFVNDPKRPTQASSSGVMCANNSDKWTWVVQAEVIKFYSP